MIFGVGADLCAVGRVAEVVARQGDRFARRILGDDELTIYQQRGAGSNVRGVRFLATRFAAKEAFGKAVGLGIRDPVRWHDCEILNAPDGRPFITLHGALARWCADRDLHFHVSLSDEEHAVLAFVVAEAVAAGSGATRLASTSDGSLAPCHLP